MCGINGFTFSDPVCLREMHKLTHHRGPDDEGFFEAPGISLAHNRLSIIDLSDSARQPMHSADNRFTIVFNGEIYNYKEIRSELETLGEKFSTKSDTEVLLKAFIKWGQGCLPKLNGIFAFAVWDKEEKKITLVRDQIGVKPLYYFWDGKKLIFSSEIKSILLHDIPRDLDYESFNLYFRFLYVPGPRTMFKYIKKLQPGHVATYTRENFEIQKWWEIKEGSYFSNREDAVSEIRRSTKEAVSRQLVSDRPLGVFLSGGIDSTSILGIMSEMTNGPVKTFSVGYETDIQPERFNADSNLAKKSAEYFGAEHHTFMLSPQDAIDSLQTIAWHMDEPVSNHIQSSTYLLAKYAKPHITVALGGDGGDELFGGYSRYWYSNFIDQIQSIPLPARNAIFSLIIGKILGRSKHVEKFTSAPGAERAAVFLQEKEDVMNTILSKDINQPKNAMNHLSALYSPPWQDPTNQMMASDIKTWIPDESLVRTDKLTMAHALEERVPLLDPNVVSLSARIPSKWKVGSRRQGK
ncbi:asparagine synthase (glutamine-hydrolyzing), partial [Patescibacteria group bacterium]|nr:asparagine synthase (glutamine-hydrolyzing) [Patescibacteria group bacterium]